MACCSEGQAAPRRIRAGPGNQYVMQTEVAAQLPIQEVWVSAGWEEDRQRKWNSDFRKELPSGRDWNFLVVSPVFNG